MFDVADHVGCSHSAVSHVLTGSGKGRIRVSKETVEKIRQTAEELDSQPSCAPRMLRGKHTGVLGVISSCWRDHTQLRVFSRVQQVTAANGYQVLTAQVVLNLVLSHILKNHYSKANLTA
jgi:DNA-binding LacI/PurR family transcriptional regulator